MKKQLDTRTIKKNILIRFYKKGFGYGSLELICNIDSFMLLKTDRDSFNALSQKDAIDLYMIVDGKGAWSWKSTVIGTIADTEYHIALPHADHIDWHTDVHHIECTRNLPIRFFTFTPDEDKTFETQITSFRKGSTLRLSDKYVFIRTFEPVQGAMLKGHIQIADDLELDILGKIVAAGENDVTKVEFIGMTDHEKGMLREFVFSSIRE